MPTTTPSPEFDPRAELGILARLALPISVAQVGFVLLGLVDTAIVGRVSVEDLAAVSMARSILFACTSIGMGVAYALEPLASQAIGGGKPGLAWGALRASLRAGVLVALPTILIALAITLALPLADIDPTIVHRVRLYLLGHAPGTIAFIAFLTGKSFLQAHGETRPALVAAVVANIVNAVACALLVLGDGGLALVGLAPIGLPRLGAFGAGIAASIASITMALIALWAAWRHRPAVPPEHVAAARVFRLAVPIGMQLLAEIGVFALVGLIAGRLGPRIVSAHQIAIGLASFTFMGAVGISGATAVRVGHAIGAGRSPRRSGLLGIALGAGIMSTGVLAFALFPRWLVGLFTPDPEIIAVGVPLLRIAAFFQLVDGVQAVASGALRGAGDVRFPFLANVAAHWLVGFPVALILGFGFKMGATGLWLGLTAGLVAIATLLTARFLRVSRGEVARIDI